MASGRIICGTSSARLTTSSVRLTARLTTSSVRLTMTLEVVSLAPGDIFFLWCKTNFLRTAGNLVGAQTGEPGFECQTNLRF